MLISVGDKDKESNKPKLLFYKEIDDIATNNKIFEQWEKTEFQDKKCFH